MISSAIWNRKAGVPQTAYSFQIAREKSLDYVMIIYMKKNQIYHNYAEEKRALQVQIKIIYSNYASAIVRSVKTTAYDRK